MHPRPAGARPALLLASSWLLLLLPARLAGLQITSSPSGFEESVDLEDAYLPVVPSPENATRGPGAVATDDPTDAESCARGRLVSGSRYRDTANRLANLRENCGPCFMNKPGAPVLFIKESNEGMGSRVQEVLTAMAVAARNGMNFGGLVSRGVCHKAHNASIVKATRALFNLNHSHDIFTEDPPVFDAVYRGVQNLEENFARGKNSFQGPDFADGANVLVQLRCISCELDGPEWGIDDYWEYWNPRFTKALRQSAAGLFAMPLVFASERPSVAVHVRRGDVSEENIRRHTPDSWYFSLVDRIKKTLPTADVHVFSSLEGRHLYTEFDPYRRRGMTVHLDEVDIAKPWAQLARADVLVMAKSSFSHVPAMFNNGCVIYEEYWHRPQKGWIVVGSGSDGKPTLNDAKLEDCLWRVADKYGTLSM